LYPRAPRSAPAPSDQILDFASVAFRHGFDRTVQAISDPTRQAEILRFLNGRSAEINALNPAPNRQMGADMLWIRVHAATFLSRQA
jgi:hypothetical protein